MVNHGKKTSQATKAAKLLVGENNVDGNCAPFTAGEDFAYMLEANACVWGMVSLIVLSILPPMFLVQTTFLLVLVFGLN